MREPRYTPWQAVGAYANRALNPLGPLTQQPPSLPGGVPGLLRMIPILGLLTGGIQAYQSAEEEGKRITHPLPKWKGPGGRDVLQALGNLARPLTMGGVGGEAAQIGGHVIAGLEGFMDAPSALNTSWESIFAGFGGQAARGLLDRTGVLRSMSQEPTWNAPQAMQWGQERERPMTPSYSAPMPEAYGIPSSPWDRIESP